VLLVLTEAPHFCSRWPAAGSSWETRRRRRSDRPTRRPYSARDDGSQLDRGSGAHRGSGDGPPGLRPRGPQREGSGRTSSRARSERRTQPATLLSQIARDIRAPAGTGGVLILHAVAVARRGARQIAATMFTLDPYDSDTAEMWKRSYGFRDSAGPGPGGDELRLWIPLEQ
jgi:hypothetical protein